ncbi:MAG: HD domain-containing protein [Angelakisella sp.]
MSISYDLVRHDPKVRSYIKRQDENLVSLGYTEHSFNHVCRVSHTVGTLLQQLEYDENLVELGRVAGYLHDLGNVINRVDHAQSGALIAFRLLEDLGGSPDDIATIISAIGNHDEGTGFPVSPVAAALILADKSDVRRSRVRERDMAFFDIHDRVNYAVSNATSGLTPDKTTYQLNLTIDTTISAVMDYFEIFLGRMLFCRKAAEKLNLKFQLVINDQVIL